MRILCTGSAGFIGTELCRKLEERGFEVWRSDRFVHSRYSPHKERFVYGDVANLDSCKRIIREAQPEIVIHLAAIATTDSFMYNHPEQMIDVTFKGTVNMGNAFGEWLKNDPEEHRLPHPKAQFIYASSSEIYGAATNPPFNEETEPHPCNVYAVSKYAGEMYLRDFFSKAYGIPYTIMRNFNTFGNTHYFRTLIDRCVKEMREGVNPIQLGNPDAVRDWEFVDDHVNSYLTVINNPKAYNETFNFCRGEAFSIRETVDGIMYAIGYTGEVEWGTGFQRKNDVPLLHGDPSKAKHVLGWEAKYSLADGLREYVKRLGG